MDSLTAQARISHAAQRDLDWAALPAWANACRQLARLVAATCDATAPAQHVLRWELLDDLSATARADYHDLDLWRLAVADAANADPDHWAFRPADVNWNALLVGLTAVQAAVSTAAAAILEYVNAGGAEQEYDVLAAAVALAEGAHPPAAEPDPDPEVVCQRSIS
jgi:hypothetical protein